MDNFREALRTQRWDDHRYYHHSRINQSLHLRQRDQLPVRLCADRSPIRRSPALIGWLVAMTTRQAGHFFFEPKDYDRQPGDPRAQGRDQGRLQSAAQGRAAVDLGAVAAAAVTSIRPCSASSTPHATQAEFVRHVGDDLARRSASAACCSAPCSCSSSRTCRPAWCG